MTADKNDAPTSGAYEQHSTPESADQRGSYDVSPTLPRIDGCPDDVCAATQLCLAPGDCYADQFIEPPCTRKGCGQPLSAHDYGEFCP